MELRKTDPEFYERFDAFAFDEVANDETAKLPMETRYLAIACVNKAAESRK